jgi:chorismate mutase
MSTLQELRAKIDKEIDPKIVRAIPGRMQYKQFLSFYGEDNRANLIGWDYSWPLVGALHVPVLKTICEPGEYAKEELDSTTFYDPFFNVDLLLHRRLVRRMGLCREIAGEKEKNGAGTYDPGRELEVIANAVSVGKEVGLDAGLVTACFTEIMACMKASQERYRSGSFPALKRTAEHQTVT